MYFSFNFAASDAGGRYRGQFLFDNNYWLGSIVICNELGRMDKVNMGFYIATILVHSPEPMMKVCSAIVCPVCLELTMFTSLIINIFLFLVSFLPVFHLIKLVDVEIESVFFLMILQNQFIHFGLIFIFFFG